MEEQTNLLNIFQRRIELMIGARLKEKSRVKEAIRVQDLIRSKTRFWDGSKEIRRWREKRAN